MTPSGALILQGGGGLPSSPTEKPLKIYPNLGLAAIKLKVSGAYRLWILARALDDGTGNVSKEMLFRVFKSLGKSLKTFKRWCNQAVETGLLREGGKHWYYASLENASRNLESSPKRAVLIPFDRFFNIGWKAFVWGAWVEANVPNTKPRTRKTLEVMSGVPQSTQRAYERVCGVSKRQNFAVWDKAPGIAQDWVDNFKEHGEHPGAFVFHGKKGAKKRVAWPLGNTYQTPFERCKRGQVRKVRTVLRWSILLQKSRRASDFTKLFYEKFRHATDASNRLAGSIIAEQYSRRTKNNYAWTVHKVN